MLLRLSLFVPLWLFLGGAFFLFARLLGRKPSVLRVLLNWPLTILMAVLVLLSGVFTYL